ncbi:Alpha/Beta hydrolase protein [Pelagophyceae sp. CCMP2097]|nr:Alpha/Beta hydrolase protein [Pelagophyceae sp. CCMP2097]
MAEAALLGAVRGALEACADADGFLSSADARAAILAADGLPNAFEGIVGEVQRNSLVNVADFIAFLQARMGGVSEEAAMASEGRLDPKIREAYALARSAPDFAESLAGPEAPGGVYERTLNCASEPDGNEVKILFFKPTSPAEAVLPAIVYFHGGGMASGSAFEPQHRRWAQFLAREAQAAVFMVDFRNYVNSSRLNPQEVKAFPAGLNDCVSGLEYVHAHASSLGIDPNRIMLAGESGGGNLAIAAALRCSRDAEQQGESEPRLEAKRLFSCWFVVSPMLAGGQATPDCESIEDFAGMPPGATRPKGGRLLGLPDEADKYAQNWRNPLAWPYAAASDDLSRLPPGTVLVNELDPLRDEGLSFFRKALGAGVDVACSTLMGSTHCANVLPGVLPRACAETAKSIRALIDRVHHQAAPA